MKIQVRFAFVCSAILVAACGPAPATSEQRAALTDAITSVQKLRVQTKNPHAFVTHVAGGVDATAMDKGAATFEPIPGLICKRVTDVDTTTGSEHIASCNDGAYNVSVSIETHEDRVHVESHSDGELPTTPGWHASIVQVFDLSTVPGLIDGNLEEHTVADNSLLREHLTRDETLIFDHVLLDGSECPVGGSASIERDDNSIGVEKFHQHVGAGFVVGPRCGELGVVSIDR